MMQQRQRATFDTTDLAVVLSHYDLGVIESITEFPRGSRRSAKVGIVADRGKFLLKQRSATRARPERIAFCHRVQSHLAAAGFPMARIVPAHGNEGMMVRHRDHVYELFEFVVGQPYDRSSTSAHQAGATLARFHATLEEAVFSASEPLPTGDYHDAPGVRVGLCHIGSTLSAHDSFSGEEAELATLVQYLLEAYERAAETVNRLGFQAWPQSVVHSDWHPGNLLFRNGTVVAVVDYDSARMSRIVTDVATGALHFSILAGDDPTNWPDHLDENLFMAFLKGYQSLHPLSPEECNAIPALMGEALIAECVPPITETGSMGRWSGFRILKMVKRKLAWLTMHGERLAQAAGQCGQHPQSS